MCIPVLVCECQRSVLGPFPFLIYVNKLHSNLTSKAKLFADDTSLFTVNQDQNENANILNNDLLINLLMG